MILTRKSKALLAAVLAFCLAVCLLPVTAQADDSIDTTRGGVITLDVAGTEDRAILKNSTVRVEIYKIASVSANGVYTAEETFAASEKITEPLKTLTSLDGIVAEAMQLIKASKAEPEEGVTPPQAIEPYAVLEEAKLVGEEIPFDTLGMYLLVFDDVIVGVNKYTFNPLLLPVPALGLEEDLENEDRSTELGGEHLNWQYEYTVFLKFEINPALTEIKIIKDLRSYNANMKDVTFIFEVTVIDEEGNTLLQDNGTPVFSRNVSITFEGTGVKELVVPQIPYGSRVRVREIYTGGYQSVSMVPEDGIVEVMLPEEGETEQIVEVTVINDGPPPVIPNAGVVNHFSAYSPAGLFNQDGTPATVWEWSKLRDNTEEGGAAK